MATADQAQLRGVVDAVVSRAGYDLEEISVVAAGRRRLVRVVIDSDHGVDLDDAAEVSRNISAELDEIDEVDGDLAAMGNAAYTLEVTSPGIGRPLTLPRHFRRARGRLLAITATDGGSLAGRILRAGDTEVDLLVGRSGLDHRRVAYADIARARVEVEFSAPSAQVLALLDAETAQKFASDEGPGDLTDDDLTDDDPIDDDPIGDAADNSGTNADESDDEDQDEDER